MKTTPLQIHSSATYQYFYQVKLQGYVFRPECGHLQVISLH